MKSGKINLTCNTELVETNYFTGLHWGHWILHCLSLLCCFNFWLVLNTCFIRDYPSAISQSGKGREEFQSSFSVHPALYHTDESTNLLNVSCKIDPRFNERKHFDVPGNIMVLVLQLDSGQAYTDNEYLYYKTPLISAGFVQKKIN